MKFAAQIAVVVAAGAAQGCIRQMATGAVANALSESGTVFSSDPDVELVGDAIPFALKTMESVLAETPEHRGLLVALTQGFTSYAYGYVYEEAHRVEVVDIETADAMRLRAKKLFFRGRDYGLRAMATEVENVDSRLRADAASALANFDRDDIPMVYWTAAAWGLGIASVGLDPEAFADLPVVDAMLRHLLNLEEDWGEGALHDFYIVLETATPGGDLESVREHFERSLQLNGGNRAGTYVSYAETVCVQQQDGAAFVEYLNKALAVDVDERPEERLANIIAQRRAQRLLDRSGDLFLDDPLAPEETSLNSKEGKKKQQS